MSIVFDLQTINSKENQYIKLARFLHDKKGREQEGLFLLEGKTIVQEAAKRNLEIKYIFTTDPSTLNQITRSSDTQCFAVDEVLMARISTTENPPPIIAIAKIPSFVDPLDSLSKSDLFIYLENISDPGNLGSIIRTAFASGVKGIYLSPNSVDVYNTKVLRSSMGTAFYGATTYIELEDLINRMKTLSQANSASLEVVGTSSHADVDYRSVQFSPFKNILLLVGNESHGLSDKAKSLCTSLVKIPLANDVESLNILAATSVILFSLKGS